MTESIKTNYVQAIKIGMAKNGISKQKELSKLSGVSENTLSKILSGKGDPSVETIEKLAVSMGYLVSEFSALGE